MQNYELLCGDAEKVLSGLDSDRFQTCITSPPYYGLRDYGCDGQIGAEATPEEYIERLVSVFREVKRTLKDDGTLWVNIGDSYSHDSKWGGSTGGKHSKALHGSTGIGRTKRNTGLKEKDLIGIPWMLAFALREDGWYLRQDIIWNKSNAFPESVIDRCTKSHEYIFLLSKSRHYYFDFEAIQEPVTSSTVRRVKSGENAPRYGGKKYTETPEVFYRTKSGRAYDYRPYKRKRDVWTVATVPHKEAHFAMFPEQLIEPCVLAGSRNGDTILDPFSGGGTTGIVAKRHGRNYVGIELNPEYNTLAKARIEKESVKSYQLGMEEGRKTIE